MKKLITLVCFSLALLLGTQNGFSQDDKYKIIEENVKAYTLELKKSLNLDSNQTAVVERAILMKEKGYYDIENNTNQNLNKAEIKSNIDNKFKKVLLKVLSEDQFSDLNNFLLQVKK